MLAGPSQMFRPLMIDHGVSHTESIPGTMLSAFTSSRLPEPQPLGAWNPAAVHLAGPQSFHSKRETGKPSLLQEHTGSHRPV